MGVDFSKERPPLAIACVAEITQLDAAQFAALRQALHTARSHSHHSVIQSDDDTEPSSPRDHNHEHDDDGGPENALQAHDVRSAWRKKDLAAAALAHAMEISSIADNDREILERMFLLMDRTGEELIHSLEFLIAAALLVKGSFTTKLELAMSCLSSDLHDKPLVHKHLLFLVSTITTVANYFGDPLLPLPVLEGIAEDAYQELLAAQELDVTLTTGTSGAQTLLVQAITKHPIVQDYISPESVAWAPR